ncbi:MAG: alpha/beta fold hydrolase [Acidobacteria bacterium]|nr:alpha/beta fold hydrolase [Acidobacteriota bacterium]
MCEVKRVLALALCVAVAAQGGLARGWQSVAAGPPQAEARVDVGGRRLNIKCSGVGAVGAPTVILESGFGNSSGVWERVQPEVAKFARVCSYDRAGLGGSDPAPTPRTVVAVTEDLHALLTNAKVPGPYVLVGHSLGGLLARLYASYYPSEVAGMVLVDSAHEDEADRGVALIPPDTLKAMLKAAKPSDLVVSHPNESLDLCSMRALMEALNWHADIPLVVLTQGVPYRAEDYANPALAPKYYQLHLEMQRDLVGRSPRGRQVIAERSGHFIHQDQPELVVNAIRQVFEEVKSKNSGHR